MNTLNITYKENYAIVQLDNGKVNAINTELAKELGEAFRVLEANETVKGVVLTGRPHAFSAGLDVMSMAGGGIKESKKFWEYYLDALQVMIRFPKPDVSNDNFVVFLTAKKSNFPSSWTRGYSRARRAGTLACIVTTSLAKYNMYI